MIRQYFLKTIRYPVDTVEKWDQIAFEANVNEVEATLKEYCRLNIQAILEAINASNLEWIQALNKVLMIISLPSY